MTFIEEMQAAEECLTEMERYVAPNDDADLMRLCAMGIMHSILALAAISYENQQS